jgi:hypothetical protein
MSVGLLNRIYSCKIRQKQYACSKVQYNYPEKRKKRNAWLKALEKFVKL